MLTPLELIAAASETGAAIQKKKKIGSGTTALIISNEEMEDIMKMVKSVEESRSLIKGISQTIKNEAKEQKERFLPILLGTLAVSILGNALSGRGVITASEETIRAASPFN